MTTQTLRRGGLDWNIPQDGKAADAYAVACTALVLARKYNDQLDPSAITARHATRLHVIAGRLWKLAEREANGYPDSRRVSSFQSDAQEIAEHYGLVCHFGGLVDGGLVIGTAEQLAKVDPERHGHVIRRLS